MCIYIYIYIYTHTHTHTHTHTCLYGEHACGYKSAESTWPSLSLCLTYSPSNIGSIFISAPPRSLLTAFCDSFDSSRARVMLQGELFEHADGNKLQLASEAKVVEGLLQSTRS